MLQGHIFCAGELKTWMKRTQSAACPNCRAEVTFYYVTKAGKTELDTISEVVTVGLTKRALRREARLAERMARREAVQAARRERRRLALAARNRARQTVTVE